MKTNISLKKPRLKVVDVSQHLYQTCTPLINPATFSTDKHPESKTFKADRWRKFSYPVAAYTCEYLTYCFITRKPYTHHYIDTVGMLNSFELTEFTETVTDLTFKTVEYALCALEPFLEGLGLDDYSDVESDDSSVLSACVWAAWWINLETKRSKLPILWQSGNLKCECDTHVVECPMYPIIGEHLTMFIFEDSTPYIRIFNLLANYILARFYINIKSFKRVKFLTIHNYYSGVRYSISIDKIKTKTVREVLKLLQLKGTEDIYNFFNY